MAHDARARTRPALATDARVAARLRLHDDPERRYDAERVFREALTLLGVHTASSLHPRPAPRACPRPTACRTHGARAPRRPTPKPSTRRSRSRELRVSTQLIGRRRPTSLCRCISAASNGTRRRSRSKRGNAPSARFEVSGRRTSGASGVSGIGWTRNGYGTPPCFRPMASLLVGASWLLQCYYVSTVVILYVYNESSTHNTLHVYKRT